MLAAALLVMASALPDYAKFNPDDALIHRHYTPAYNACAHAPDNGGTFQQAQCMSAEDDRQDRALQAVWRRLMARMDVPSREALRIRQRAWIKAREVASQGIADDFVNSTRALVWASSYADETIRRTIWLEKLR